MYRQEHGELPSAGDFYSGSTMPRRQSWDTIVLQSLRDEGLLGGHGPILDPWGRYYCYDDNEHSLGQCANDTTDFVGKIRTVP